MAKSNKKEFKFPRIAPAPAMDAKLSINIEDNSHKYVERITILENEVNNIRFVNKLKIVFIAILTSALVIRDPQLFTYIINILIAKLTN